MKPHSEALQFYHMKALALRIQHQHISLRKQLMDQKFYKTAVDHGAARAIIADEKIYGMVGILDFEGVSILWATFSFDAGKHAAWIYKHTHDLLQGAWKRPVLVMHIETHFQQAKRLAKIMGFTYDRILCNFGIDGLDRELWVKQNVA